MFALFRMASSEYCTGECGNPLYIEEFVLFICCIKPTIDTILKLTEFNKKQTRELCGL